MVYRIIKETKRSISSWNIRNTGHSTKILKTSLDLALKMSRVECLILKSCLAYVPEANTHAVLKKRANFRSIQRGWNYSEERNMMKVKRTGEI